MDRYAKLLLSTSGTALGLVVLVWLCAYIWAKTPEKKHKWYAIAALVLAIYCTCTSWIWVYYTNFFFCFPFYIASLLLMYLAWRNNGISKLLKTTMWFQAAAVFLALVSYILFAYLS